MVFETIVGGTSSTKVAREGKPTCGHWPKSDLCNQIFSQMKSGLYPLEIYKTSS
jgi:hypothetical protein